MHTKREPRKPDEDKPAQRDGTVGSLLAVRQVPIIRIDQTLADALREMGTSNAIAIAIDNDSKYLRQFTNATPAEVMRHGLYPTPQSPIRQLLQIVPPQDTQPALFVEEAMEIDSLRDRVSDPATLVVVTDTGDSRGTVIGAIEWKDILRLNPMKGPMQPSARAPGPAAPKR